MSGLRKRANRGEVPANVETLQDAIYETVHNTAGVEPKQLAEAARMRYRDLLDIANPYAQRRLRAEEIAPLVNGTFLVSGVRCYLVLDVLERMVDRVSFQVPRGASAECKTQADAVLQFGEYLQEAAEAGADRRYSAEEIASIERAAEDVVRAVMAHVEVVKASAAIATAPASLRSVAR
jgi:hypothetical protein